MESTWELLQKGCPNFSEDPRNDERCTEETAVTDSCRFLGDARCSRGTETTGQRRAARKTTRHDDDDTMTVC